MNQERLAEIIGGVVGGGVMLVALVIVLRDMVKKWLNYRK